MLFILFSLQKTKHLRTHLLTDHPAPLPALSDNGSLSVISMT
jgi:hypothetical protein